MVKTATRRKCCICQKMFTYDMIYTIEGKNYCHPCGDEFKAKELKEIKKNKELNDYLYRLAGQDRDLMPLLGRQAKTLKEEHSWRTESILATLRYAFDICDPPAIFRPEFGIKNLVEAYYYPAKKYYEKVFELRKTPDEVIQEILLMPPKEIVLKRSALMKKDEVFSEKKKNLTYGPVLDMDDIIDDEEFYEERDY